MLVVLIYLDFNFKVALEIISTVNSGTKEQF